MTPEKFEAPRCADEPHDHACFSDHVKHTISAQRLTELFGMRLWDDGQDCYFYSGMGLEKFTVEPSFSSHLHPIFRAGGMRRSINLIPQLASKSHIWLIPLVSFDECYYFECRYDSLDLPQNHGSFVGGVRYPRHGLVHSSSQYHGIQDDDDFRNGKQRPQRLWWVRQWR